jgi:hypothetical protein
MSQKLNKRQLAPAILEASTRLLVAQRELSAAMADLVVPGEPDATMVTDRLRLAFAEVTAAKQALAVLVGVDL